MKDHQTETIEQLRAILKETQRKLENRTRMLATLTPYLLTAHETGDDIENYLLFEFFERHEIDLKEFKDEYGKENQLQQNKDSKL